MAMKSGCTYCGNPDTVAHRIKEVKLIRVFGWQVAARKVDLELCEAHLGEGESPMNADVLRRMREAIGDE